MLQGKKILVAGAGPGLGAATAYLALRMGASVAIAARSRGRLEGLRASLSRYGPVHAVEGDLSTEAGAEAVVDAAYRALGGLDGVAVTAGGYLEGGLDSVSEGDLEKMIRANLYAHLFAAKAAAKRMRGGSIVFVSAIWGSGEAWPRHVAYVASKAALSHLVETLAAELLPKGIRVNAVAPGGMSHDFKPERDWAQLVKLGASVAPPEAVAEVVVWLLSDRSRWVTGAVVPADGGARLAEE
ncbi:MAG: SDR family oxidoreductase [Thermoproteus sp. AZ2]|jgi:3-oxoacyl-[acyl-carrier protein] reductase|uniref:SDR family oxidoreductase n=1 Tax=Thermoproteus sp. AZ2 TaxID=1609232 RepID=A0ACC6V1H8_9CREN|nr:MAG: 3-ketoacyl-ACP reductase [Thermoproteus sp. AZ2]